MQSRNRNLYFQLVIRSALLLLRYSFSWSIPILVLAVSTLDSSAQTQSFRCNLTSLSEWDSEFLYSVSKQESYDTSNKVTDTKYALEKESIGTIGVDQIDLFSQRFSYQIFNITPRTSKPFFSKVIVEIEYTSFQGTPGNLRLKELPLVWGSAHVQSGSQGQGVSDLIKLIEKRDDDKKDGEVTVFPINNNPESYCPTGVTTIRFEITNMIPEGKAATETVWAIGPAESTRSSDKTIFKPTAIRVYRCEGSFCIRPEVKDLPPQKDKWSIRLRRDTP